MEKEILNNRELDGRFKKGFTPWNGGKNLTKQHIKNLSISHKGNKHSKETKRKMKGRISWNKGKKYEELFGEKKAKEIKKEMSERKKGIKLQCNNWNKGLKMSEDHKKNHKLAMQNFRGENNPSKKSGVGEKISIAKTGKKFPIDKYPNMGVRGFRYKLKIPKKDSSIEVKIQKFLKELGIEFFTHQYMKIEHGYQCDILIPSMNLVIEADGDYWHKYPIGNDIDHIRTRELISNGFKVLRLWEFEIKEMNINDFKNKLGEVKKNAF